MRRHAAQVEGQFADDLLRRKMSVFCERLELV